MPVLKPGAEIGRFQYRAMAPDGSVVLGKIEAIDRRSAVAQLQSRGFILLALEVSVPITGLRALLSREIGGGQRALKVAELIGRMALLLEAGIALEGTLAPVQAPHIVLGDVIAIRIRGREESGGQHRGLVNGRRHVGRRCDRRTIHHRRDKRAFSPARRATPGCASVQGHC